jgi:uncharacterized protein YukE
MTINAGMDVSDVQGLAAMMKTSAGRLDDLSSALSGQLADVSWEGADKQSFMSSWEGMKAQLLGASSLLTKTGTHLMGEATAQQDASTS